MPGAQCTRSLACKSVSSTRAYSPRLQPESPGIPARNGFNGLFRALPGDRAFLPPSSADQGSVRARSGAQTSANLTPASGRQDHTTSPSASTVYAIGIDARPAEALAKAKSAVRQRAVDGSREARPAITSRARHCRVHRIPFRVRDDRDTPLCGTGRQGI
jgi:hypothetical protein